MTVVKLHQCAFWNPIPFKCQISRFLHVVFVDEFKKRLLGRVVEGGGVVLIIEGYQSSAKRFPLRIVRLRLCLARALKKVLEV